MSDDGLLVNFSIGDSIPISRPIYKTGSWKARQVANRLALKRSRSHENTVKKSQKGSRDDEHNSQNVRPAKRQRIEDEGTPERAVSHKESRARGAIDKSQEPQPQKQGISSLFTYNPKTT